MNAGPFGLAELRENYPEWQITDGATGLTAVLRDDPDYAATRFPVSVAVMSCVLADWRVESVRPRPW